MKFRDIFDDFTSRGQKAPEMQVPLSDMESYEHEQQEIIKTLERERKLRSGLGRLLKHPFQVLTERPTNVLFASIPIALIVFISGFSILIAFYGIEVIFTTTMVDDLFILAVLIAVTPLAILDFQDKRRIRSLEEALPNFFRDVAGMNDSGMTLPNAVHVVAQGEYGSLTPHVKKLDADMSWNVPFVEAIYRFGMRVATPLAVRSVDLIAKASKAGGNASEVLRAAATDTYEFFNLKTDRRNSMLIYMVIIFVAFAVFLFVIAILVSTFLTTMAEAGAAVAGSGAAGRQFIGTVDIFFYKRLFSHAGLIQGFFSGLVAGQMGEGDAMAGFKYSIIMLVIAWLTFRFFI
ncbi:MAG: type II secretion system F family protein [Methanomicrobiales archaeon]|nr:type II secretion system F family protein [Methanomicrobiales archaeon]